MVSGYASACANCQQMHENRRKNFDCLNKEFTPSSEIYFEVVENFVTFFDIFDRQLLCIQHMKADSDPAEFQFLKFNWQH